VQENKQKKEWARLRHNLPCLYFNGCLKLMQGAQENHTRAWEKKKTIWKPRKLEQFLNQNEKAMCLKNMKKQKNQRKQCAWKMKTLISKIKT
jgi:hypothetical protein